MQEKIDIDAAVEAGVITARDATALRKLSAGQARVVPDGRLGRVGGARDIMAACAVGATVGLCSVLLIARFMATPLAALSLIPVLGCAEWFSRRRRMTLTSFVLFAIFAVALAVTCFSIALLAPVAVGTGNPASGDVIAPLHGLLTSGGTALGCGAYFRRYRLPIAYAAAAIAAVNFFVHALQLLAPEASAFAVSLVLLLAGAAFFGLALWWDRWDMKRKTYRTDVAYWLHAAAGFQIAGACFRLIVGVTGEPVGWNRLYSFTLADFSTASAAWLLMFAAIFAVISLAINRPSLLTSSIAFVLPALAFLAGGGALGWLVSLIAEGVIGLLLSISWPALRRTYLAVLPDAGRSGPTQTWEWPHKA